MPTEIYVPRGQYNLTLFGSGDSDAYGDLHIDEHVIIVGSGAGATIIDGSMLATRDRIFEIKDTGALSLSGVTLTGGVTNHDGGAIRVSNNTNGAVRELTLEEVAIVFNRATNVLGLGNGGGIYFEPSAAGRIERSVITDKYADEAITDGGGGGIYAGHPGTLVTLRDTIVAKNTAAAGSDLLSIGSAQFASEDGNMFTNVAGATFTTALPSSDFRPGSAGYSAPNQVVASVVDSYTGSNATRAKSIRDAVFNAAEGQSIWLPAWNYMLTRARTTATNLAEIDVSQGDIDITKSLNIRGAGQTPTSGTTTKASVAWRTGAPVDDIFELIGDYNDDGIIDGDPANVDSADYTVWQDTNGSSGDNLAADGNDDGVVNSLDHQVWKDNFNNTLTLANLIEIELT